MQHYFPKSKKNDEFILYDTDIHHIKNVMRMKDNDEIKVIYEEEVYLCRVRINDSIKIEIIEKLKSEKENMPKVTIIIPLLKEQKMDYILQKSTELGVDTIIPIETKRSIIKIEKKKEKKKYERWNLILKEASEQSHRLSIPKLEEIQKLEELNINDGVKLLCSTREKKKNLKKILKKMTKCDKIYVVIGPEGGFDEKEEEKLIELGFEPVSLGNRILRAETTPMFVLSTINYEFME